MAKLHKDPVVIIAVVIAVVALLAVVIVGASKLASQQLSKKECAKGEFSSHTFAIQNGKIEPSDIQAGKCDKLTVINKDDTTRRIAFGVHDSHTPYDGISEKILNQDQSFTVTLVQTGDFKVHDHYDDNVLATFSVN